MPLKGDLVVAGECSILILLYHAIVRKPLDVFDWCFIAEAEFEAQLEYLRGHYDVVPLTRIPALLREPPTRPTVALTFDDGFLNNYEVAYPLLRQAELPATIFICTDFIDTDDTLWYCNLNRAITNTGESQLQWDGRVYDLTSGHARARASSELQAQVKEGTPGELSAAISAIIRKLGVSPLPPLDTGSPYRILTSAAIREMQRSELIDFGAHTKSHTILRRLSPAERRSQIEDSIQALEHITGRRCSLFAYPNGRARDYDQECVQMLTEAGIAAAVTAITGNNGATVPPLELRRIGIGGDLTMSDFKAALSGAAFDGVQNIASGTM